MMPRAVCYHYRAIAATRDDEARIFAAYDAESYRDAAFLIASGFGASQCHCRPRLWRDTLLYRVNISRRPYARHHPQAEALAAQPHLLLIYVARDDTPTSATPGKFIESRRELLSA